MAFLQEWVIQLRSYNRNINLAIIANILTQIGLGMFMFLLIDLMRRLP